MQTKQGIHKGLWVKVVVDGEIHEGEVTRVNTRLIHIKIPYYYSLSEKHGKMVKDNTLTVKEKPELVMI